MATTAVSQLQEQIEAIRREAFAAGFEAAMRSVRQFAATQMPDVRTAEPARPRRSRRSRADGASPHSGAAANASRRGSVAPGRLQRGTNARLVEEVLQSNAPRALRPAEIRGTIQRDKGMAIAFTSIRHALGQLDARGAIEQVADTNTWRWRGGGSDSFGEAGSAAATTQAE
jgi:hypothetical protein